MNKNKLIKNVFFITGIGLLFSCSEKFKEDLLPKDVVLVKQESLPGVLDEIYIYNILDANINLDLLKGYPKSCKGANCTNGCSIVEWVCYKDIDGDESKKLIHIIRSENEIYEHSSINELISTMKENDNLLFSSCYREAIGSEGKKYKFYEIMSFIDLEKKTLYVFDYMEDPF